MKYIEVGTRTKDYIYIKAVPVTDEDKYFLKHYNEDDLGDLDSDLKQKFSTALIQTVVNLDLAPNKIMSDFPKDFIFKIQLA